MDAINSKHALWTEKYRPQTLSDYIFHDENQRVAITRMVNDKSIPHLLLSGVQGSGKTSLSQILINELNVDFSDVLVLNASDENNVDVMRDKVKSFISTFAMGDFKVVRLEEADYISGAGQAVLRNMMEEYHEVARFILTCNYENKIIPPIKSRCQQFRFKASDKNEITEFVAKILLQEKIKFDLDTIDKYVAVGYPDVRKIINLLQQNSNDGKLTALQTESENGDYKFALLTLLESGKWTEARKITCANVATEEWEDLYRFLYENLNRCPNFQTSNAWESGIVIIADHLYKHSLCADPELNAAAMFIRLSQI